MWTQSLLLPNTQIILAIDLQCCTITSEIIFLGLANKQVFGRTLSRKFLLGSSRHVGAKTEKYLQSFVSLSNPVNKRHTFWGCSGFIFSHHSSGTKLNNLIPKNFLPNSRSSQPRTTCCLLNIWTPTPEPSTFASYCTNKKVLFTAWDLRQWKAFNLSWCSWIKC